MIKRLKKQLGQKVIIDSEYDHRPRRPLSSIRIPGFCERTCNNGWMRQLENETIPILSPMFLGRSCELNSSGQLTLATWMAVRAVVFDCLRPPRFYDSRETAHLLSNVTPPDSTFGVWLGYSSTALAFTDGKRLTRRNRAGRLVNEGYVLTMAFGHVILQFLTIRKPHDNLSQSPLVTIRLDAVRGPWDLSCERIWPLTLCPIAWSSERPLNPLTGELHGFANRFNTSAQRSPT